MSGLVFSTKAQIKAIDTTTIPNGLCLASQDVHSWYQYDVSSVEGADNDLILLPDSGTGRWYKMNSSTNLLNTVNISLTTTSSTTVADFTNYEQVRIQFTQNSIVNFQSTLRNGYCRLIVDRNGGAWNITSWDSRILWNKWMPVTTPYNWSTNTIAILDFVVIGSVIYGTNISEI
jgi:hypothetical protein